MSSSAVLFDLSKNRCVHVKEKNLNNGIVARPRSNKLVIFVWKTFIIDMHDAHSKYTPRAIHAR